MADAEEEVTPPQEEVKEEVVAEAADGAGEEAPAAVAEEAKVEEEAASAAEGAQEDAQPSEGDAEAPAEAPAEGEGEAVEGEAKPEGEGEAGGEEEVKAGGEEGGEEGGEKTEAGEQQEGDSEQPAEPSQAVEGSVEAAEGGEQVDGAPSEAVGEGGESVAPTEQTEEGEPAEPGEPTEEGAEKPEKPEGEEEEGEKKEGEEAGEGEPKDKEGEEPEPDAGAEAKVEGEEEKEPGEERVASEAGDAAAEVVGQRLSREPTPEVDAASPTEQERLEATTPDKLGELQDGALEEQEGEQELREEEEEEHVMEEEPQFRREDLIEKYHEALAEREQLQHQNYLLQNKLGEYFRKKKADERQDYDKNVTDQEQRYLKYMAQLEDLRRQESMEKENYRAQIEDAKDRCQERKEKVDGERKRFMEFKQHVALNAINSRSGKPIPPKDIDQYMANEIKKEQEVVNVRLENIKLKNKMKKKEQQLKSKEELAEGLHLIDFEQLKIENQTYNEKIEERNEELLKLRKKITSTVQVLTHLKEKLQFVQGENLEQNNELKDVEATLAQSRDILSRTKQARDALRIDNQRLRQNCGLLGNESLLRDFEERKDEGDDLKAKLEQLRMKHAELTLHCNQVRRKIDQARQAIS